MAVAIICFLSAACSGFTAPQFSDDYEIRYEYRTGGVPADRHVSVVITINSREGLLTREDTPVHNPRGTTRTTIPIPVHAQTLKDIHTMLTERGFFSLRTKRVTQYDARTLSLSVRAGRIRHSCELTPTTAPATDAQAERFAAIARDFISMVRPLLPDDQRHFINF